MSTAPDLSPRPIGEDRPTADRPPSDRAGSRWPPDPAGIIRVVLGTAILAVTGFMAANTDPSVVEINLFRLVNELPSGNSAPLAGVMSLGALGAVPVLAGLAALARRLRLARDLLVAGSLAWVLSKLVQVVVNQQPPEIVLPKVLLRGAATPGLAFPASHVAVAAAMAAVAGIYLTRPQRRLAWMVVAAIGIARIYIGAHFPIDVAGGAALGWSVGSAVRLLTPRVASLADCLPGALEGAGVSCPTIRPLGTRQGGDSYSVIDGAGRRWHVAVIGPDQPEADWLYRAWRLLAFRDTDDRAVPTPEHHVERAAYHHLLAAAAGAAESDPVHTGRLSDVHAWVARPWVTGRPLSEYGEALDAPTLLRAWDQLARLHGGGLSHGAITPGHVIITANGDVRLVGLGSGATPPSPSQRARDIAELALALSANAGVDPTVTTLVARLGVRSLDGVVASLQPLAVATAARATASAHPSLMDDLREAVAEATATPAPPPIRPARVAARNLFPIVALGVAVYVLLPQAAHMGSTLTALRHANAAWLAVVGVATVCTYLASSAVWVAAAPVRLALGRTFVVQFAAAAANRVTPAGLGGMATNIDYLQRAGATRAESITATAINSGAGLVVHVVGLVAVTILGVGDPAWHVPTADLGDHWPVLLGVTFGLAALGAIAGWRWAAHVRHRLGPVVRDVKATVRALIAHPARTLALLVASSGVTASYAGAFAASAYAYGASASVAKLALVYLGAAAVAAAAPTPGGLGALDAALVAGLGAAGTPAASAVAAVLTYRTVTYWLPVIPGVFALRALRSRQLL